MFRCSKPLHTRACERVRVVAAPEGDNSGRHKDQGATRTVATSRLSRLTKLFSLGKHQYNTRMTSPKYKQARLCLCASDRSADWSLQDFPGSRSGVVTCIRARACQSSPQVLALVKLTLTPTGNNERCCCALSHNRENQLALLLQLMYMIWLFCITLGV